MKKLIGYLKEINRSRNHKTKELKRRVKLLNIAYRIPDKRNEKISHDKVNRILFPFVDLGIGDAICHTGIWHILKNAGYSIQLVAEERNRELFEKMTDIDELFIVDVNNIDQLENITTDLVISHYSWMKRKELFNIQLLQKINYKYAISFGGWLTKPWNVSIPVFKGFHVTAPQIEILKALNISVPALEYSLPPIVDNDAFIEQYLSTYTDKKIIVINPFASVGERSLSLSELEKLTDLISKNEKVHIFIVGEKKKLEKIKTNNPSVSICIFNSLWDTVSLIKKSDLVISVDTAIVHIACAANKKLIAIYYSMHIDHNAFYEGNVIFSPIGENSHQLLFDRHNNPLNINSVYAKANEILNISESNY
ncbi:lipopolysaccharide heptosyltransferase family protein [Scandinavium goeteborgense]|uniref:glycosyltransferase family 9 protein n=1 Tax=Scandinavium goeteborgense TaxID=1851514 RepID=UPI0021660A8B|nr:glycosyltransferase family 9 protein [Scandinavium goeteborgense]MCS2151591.1 lipopolysaccharide heptosyltransferase family protein [Scandinavium goeteborgense]